MSIYIRKMVDNVLNTSFENLSREVLENVKCRIIDVLGCIISGANAAGNLDLINLAKDWGGKEEATIFVFGGRVPVHNAAMVNSVMARSYDFEATQARVNGINFPSHISGTTVTTALAMGEAADISGKELITALLVGEDVACRILAASGFGFSRGWDNVGTVNAFGATAIAGRLLKLSTKQLQNAFGIVLNQLAGSFDTIWDGAAAFKLVQGLSARNGIFSAELAKTGWTGSKDALLGEFGYFKLYTEGCVNPEILIQDMGKKFNTEVTIKPYPGCRLNHTAIDCAIDIINKNDLNIDEIEQIELEVPAIVHDVFVSQPFVIRDIPQIDAAFNIRFSVANILLRKDLKLEHFKEELIRDPHITYIANKIIIKESKDQVCLKLKMKDGINYSTAVSFAKGEPVLSPLTIDEIKQKFMDNIAFSRTISEENAEKIISLVENLEKVDNIKELINLMIDKN